MERFLYSDIFLKKMKKKMKSFPKGLRFYGQLLVANVCSNKSKLLFHIEVFVDYCFFIWNYNTMLPDIWYICIYLYLFICLYISIYISIYLSIYLYLYLYIFVLFFIMVVLKLCCVTVDKLLLIVIWYIPIILDLSSNKICI